MFNNLLNCVNYVLTWLSPSSINNDVYWLKTETPEDVLRVSLSHVHNTAGDSLLTSLPVTSTWATPLFHPEIFVLLVFFPLLDLSLGRNVMDISVLTFSLTVTGGSAEFSTRLKAALHDGRVTFAHFPNVQLRMMLMSIVFKLFGHKPNKVDHECLKSNQHGMTLLLH